jgi:hypothetical protein
MSSSKFPYRRTHFGVSRHPNKSTEKLIESHVVCDDLFPIETYTDADLKDGFDGG